MRASLVSTSLDCVHVPCLTERGVGSGNFGFGGR